MSVIYSLLNNFCTFALPMGGWGGGAAGSNLVQSSDYLTKLTKPYMLQ